MIQVAFIGDVCVTGSFAERFQSGDFELLEEEVKNYLHTHDFVVANLEGPITNAPNTLRPNKRIVNPLNTEKFLAEANIHIANLANNHICDCGEKGICDTIEALEKENIQYFGAGTSLKEASAPLYITQDDITIAFIGFGHKEGIIASKDSPGIFCIKQWNQIQKQVTEAKKHADHIVLNYHGGEEYTRYPMPSRRRILHKLTELPISLIICHHPHVFQGVEEVNNVPIWYSLGNFIFDVPNHYHRLYTDDSAIVSFLFDKTDCYPAGNLAVYINRSDGQVEIAPDAQEWVNEQFPKLCNFSAYFKQWRREAFRVFRANRLTPKKLFAITPKCPNQANNRFLFLLKKLFRPSFYKNLWLTLKVPESRAIFFSAIQYMIWNKILKRS